MPDLSLGQLVRNTRAIRGLTIKQLANVVGISQDALSIIERDIGLPIPDFLDDYVPQTDSEHSLRTMHILMKISDILELDKNHILSKAGMLPSTIIKGFLEFPEEIKIAEKYFAEKLAYRKTPEGQEEMRKNPT